MSELINTYLLSEPDKPLAQKRSEFYTEQIDAFKETGHPSRACDIVNIFLINSRGEILIQKRSMDKNHNPGLLDKSIGGHVTYGDTFDYTVMVESIQELQAPSIVLRSQNDFTKTLQLLNEYSETLAIVKHIDTEIYQIEKIIAGEPIVIANRSHVYFGLYDGRTRPVDGEAQGVLYYGLDQLCDELEKIPQAFTHDLHFFIEYYREQLQKFINEVAKK